MNRAGLRHLMRLRVGQRAATSGVLACRSARPQTAHHNRQLDETTRPPPQRREHASPLYRHRLGKRYKTLRLSSQDGSFSMISPPHLAATIAPSDLIKQTEELFITPTMATLTVPFNNAMRLGAPYPLLPPNTNCLIILRPGLQLLPATPLPRQCHPL